MNNDKIRQSVDVHKIYTASDKELLELAKPYNIHFIHMQEWFDLLAKQLSTHRAQTTPHKIKNIYYGKSKLTAIERITLEDLARRQAISQKDPRQLSLLEGVNG